MHEVVFECDFGAVSIRAEGTVMEEESFGERMMESKVSAILNGEGVAIATAEEAAMFVFGGCMRGAWTRSTAASWEYHCDNGE